mgnify:CR=1 FL=1|jgi:aryl sulfotransferase
MSDPELEVAKISPWMDLRLPPKVFKPQLVAVQTRGHFFKTYLPVDALYFYDKAKYIYIGRDVRGVIWSLVTTMLTLTDFGMMLLVKP